MAASAATGALILSAVAGAHPLALAVAAGAYFAAIFAGPILKILLLLAAPVLLAAGTPLETLFTPVALLALGAALLSLAPFVIALGPGRPSWRAAVVVAGSLAVPVGLAYTLPGAALLSSDLATGAQVVALGAGLLVAASAGAVRA